MNNKNIFFYRRMLVFVVLPISLILILWFMISMIFGVVSHLASSHDDEVDTTLFDGRECNASELRIEAKLGETNVPAGAGVHFSIEITMSGATPCKVPTDFKNRKLTITDTNGAIVYAVTDQCVTEDAGLIILPGETSKEDVYWRGKTTTRLKTSPQTNDEGEEMVDNAGNPLLDENGKPMIKQWCEPGDIVDKGSYIAQFAYDSLPGSTVKPALISNQIGFNIL